MEFNKNNKVSLNNKELIKGLTNEEVKKHIKEGNYNKSIDSMSKTTKEIIIDNVFTFFKAVIVFIVASGIVAIESL